MRRREFLCAVGSAALWPVAAQAQRSLMPVVGFLNSTSPGPYAHLVAAFRQGLAAAGFIERQNVAIEYRWAKGRYERLPELARELVRRRVEVIAATGGPKSGLAAKAATSSIPIVFISGSDPVKAGLVGSLDRPEGNATGVTFFADILTAKRLELLHELVPNAGTLAVLGVVNPNNADTQGQLPVAIEAAHKIRRELLILNAQNDSEIESSFATLSQRSIGALVIAGDPFFASRRNLLNRLIKQHAIAAASFSHEIAASDIAIAYGPRLTDVYRQTGLHVGRILKGAKPTELPVQRATRFELIVNRRTIKALGLALPSSLLLRADEVID